MDDVPGEAGPGPGVGEQQHLPGLPRGSFRGPPPGGQAMKAPRSCALDPGPTLGCIDCDRELVVVVVVVVLFCFVLLLLVVVVVVLVVVLVVVVAAAKCSPS